MAYVFSTRAAPQADLFTRAYGVTLGKVTGWNDARTTRKTLSALSARELADIGLVAGDIDEITTSAAQR